MTTSHLSYYLIAVLIITSLAYVYTSQVEAPNVAVDEKTNTPFVDDETKEEILDENDNEETIKNGSTLVGSSWMWTGILDENGQLTFSPRQPEAYMLQFTDSRMSSRTDCNTIGGSYSVSGDNITMGEIMSTLMYCEDSDEAVYTSGLSKVTSFKEDNGELYLKLTDGFTFTFVSRIPN